MFESNEPLSVTARHQEQTKNTILRSTITPSYPNLPGSSRQQAAVAFQTQSYRHGEIHVPQCCRHSQPKPQEKEKHHHPFNHTPARKGATRRSVRHRLHTRNTASERYSTDTNAHAQAHPHHTHQVKGGLLLHVVIGQGELIVELSSAEDETLVARRDPLLSTRDPTPRIGERGGKYRARHIPPKRRHPHPRRQWEGKNNSPVSPAGGRPNFTKRAMIFSRRGIARSGFW